MKKYIITKETEYGCIIDTQKYKEQTGEECYIPEYEIIKQADTIEELCDIFAIKFNTGYLLVEYYDKKLLTLDANAHDAEVYGGIWTDEGLIFVAKMNKKGELELL